MDKFWVVWNPAEKALCRKHKSFLIAQNEAARLSNRQPLDEFYVIECCGEDTFHDFKKLFGETYGPL